MGPTTRRKGKLVKGIIAGGSPYTVEAGAEILRRGGNAVDAAVAATFAGFVAEAAISSPGGGGFAILQGPDRAPVVYDFFCQMPGLGRGDLPDMDFVSVLVSFEDTTDHFHVGRASTAVPGNLAGLAALLADAGTLPLSVVLEPGIRLARDGYTLTEGQAYIISVVGRAILCYTPGSAAIFAPHGELLRAGERFANPALAETFEHLAAVGCSSLYTGELAGLLVADHAAHRGLITAEDLASYRVIKRAPLRFTYRDQTLYTNPPPSTGGILIAYALRLLERAVLDVFAHGDADHVALLAEIMRQANVARHEDHPAALPDAAAWDAWLDETAVGKGWQRVQQTLTHGRPARTPDLPGGPGSTTHVSVMDESGLAVGITTTPGETGGYVVSDTGLLMNNILGEADINPHGFHQWEPGARLVSMMAPTLVCREGNPVLVVGSGGSNRLRSAILQLLSNVLDWGLPLDQAVSRGRVHFENDLLDLEAGFDPAAAGALERRGYRVTRWSDQSLYFGGTHAVQRAADGRLIGAGDARRGGAVAVVD
jgi:gamma-glutamyltranspeptidase/glutathione hydrolase